MTMAQIASRVTDVAIRGKQEQLAGEARKAGVGFESILLHMMLEPLEKAGESFFGGGSSGRIFGGLYRQKISDQMAESTPLGVAKLIEDSVRQRLGAAPSHSPAIDTYREQLGKLRADQTYERTAP
ncbi:MAG: rod-binding protein [Planctomycetota bacterium]